MARKKRSVASGISLPWERRGAFLREILAGPRWKILLFAVGLAVAASAVYRDAQRRDRYRDTRLSISEVHTAIAEFRTEVGRCPRSTTELLHPPRTGARYLRAMPKDGWGRTLWVRCPGRLDPDGADVISAGPSGSFLEDDNVH